MKILPSFSSFTLSLLPAAIQSAVNSTTTWPDPVALTGNISGIHDPSLIKRSSDNTWFRFSTQGNIAIASAPNITGPWTYLGSMLPEGSSINVSSDQGLWAPDVSFINKKYTAYYAVSTLGSQDSDIGVATSDDMSPGSWTDHGSIGIPQSDDYNLIDPNWFRQNGSSPVYFQFGSGWKEIYQTQLDADTSLSHAQVAEKQIAYNSTGALVEGSFMFWWGVDGQEYYYLFFSSGKCCNTPPDLPKQGNEYKIMVCRSTSVTGPFADKDGNDCRSESGGTLVLGSHGDNVYAPGGQGLYNDPSLKSPIVYYHYVNPSIGYEFDDFQFGFNYLDFSSGWPVVVA